MDDQPQNDENTNQDTPAPTEAPAEQTDNPSEANAPAPVDTTKSRSNARKGKGTGDVKPGGEQRVDSGAAAHVLGEGADNEFDPVAHGKQTALENHMADQPQA